MYTYSTFMYMLGIFFKTVFRNIQLKAIKTANLAQRVEKLEQRLSVDTSAILAMLRNETEASMFAKAVEEAGRTQRSLPSPLLPAGLDFNGTCDRLHVTRQS
jgi:hypothetical protein